MFIVEGIPAIVWAFFWWKLVENKPEEAKWLTDEEKENIASEMKEEQKGMIKVAGYKEMFRNKTVLILAVQYFAWSIGVYGFVMWLPSMIKAASHMDIVATGWLSAAPYLLATIGMIAVSYFSDKTLNRKSCASGGKSEKEWGICCGRDF